MRGYITFEPETAAGGGGIALLIVMVAMAGALGNSPKHEKAQTTLQQTNSAPHNEEQRQISEPTLDPFAAVVPTEASTSGELISEPSEIGAPAEEVQSESASESATVREPIETNAPNEIVH